MLIKIRDYRFGHNCASLCPIKPHMIVFAVESTSIFSFRLHIYVEDKVVHRQCRRLSLGSLVKGKIWNFRAKFRFFFQELQWAGLINAKSLAAREQIDHKLAILEHEHIVLFNNIIKHFWVFKNLFTYITKKSILLHNPESHADSFGYGCSRNLLSLKHVPTSLKGNVMYAAQRIETMTLRQQNYAFLQCTVLQKYSC